METFSPLRSFVNGEVEVSDVGRNKPKHHPSLVSAASSREVVTCYINGTWDIVVTLGHE
jgi:hypothetical protein